MQDQNQQVFRKKIPIPLIFLFTMEMNMEILGLLIMIGGLLIPALQMFCWPLFGGWLPLTTEVLFSRILPYEFYIWLQDESTLKQIISYIAEDMSLFVFLETIGMIMVFLGGILETSTNIAAEKYSRLKSDAPYQQSLRKKIPIPLILLITVGACLFLTRSVNINEGFVDVVMVNKSLPAATPITNEHISVEMVSGAKLPMGKLINATSVIGRVLAVAVYEGQILTESCLVPYGSAQHLIAQIPDGMRAFAVYVNSRSMPDRALLKPGCIVDVLVSYRLAGSDSSEGEALYTTMLRGIKVLAVSGELVVTEPINEEEEKANTKSKKSGESKVTLLVTPIQAKALSLAQNNGDILLTIRNPNDKKEFDEDPSILNRRKLTPRGAELPPAEDFRYDSATHLIAQIPHEMRAVTVPVSSKPMPNRALLHPGCIVDVLAVYKMSGKDAVSTTMLREIQVLAILGESVISASDNKNGTKRHSSTSTFVTLLVDTKQAEALTSAIENGTLSISLLESRNRKVQPLPYFHSGPCVDEIL